MSASSYIIKPHGLIFHEEIRAMIEASGLIIIESKRVVLPEWALKRIYYDLAEKYRNAVFRQYTDAIIEVGLVSGENAIEKLFYVAGTELDPIDCAPGSIRFKFGGREPFIVDGIRCYDNIIHRPRNESEAAEGIEIFYTL